MRLYKQIAPHVTGAEFVESYYYQDSNFSAATSVDRKTIQSPDFLALDIGGSAYQKTSSQQFSLDADASWDFGQNIGTWQANATYGVGDFVKASGTQLLSNPIWDYNVYSSTSGVVKGTKPSARNSMALVLIDNYMYIFGGNNNLGVNLNDVHRLNLDTLTWSGTLTCSGTPPSIRRDSAAYYHSGYLYILGGSSLNDVHRLNLDTLTWSGTLTCSGTSPTSISRYVSYLRGNYVYVLVPATAELYRLDLTTLEWSGVLDCSNNPTGGDIYFGIVGTEDSLYMLKVNTTPYTIYKLDLLTLAWTSVLTCSGTNPSYRSFNSSIFIYNNFLYIYGGSGTNPTYKNDVHRLNLSTLEWSGELPCIGRPPVGLFNMRSVVYNGYMYTFGGHYGSGSIDNTSCLNLSDKSLFGFRCTSAGVSGSSEPMWNTLISGTTSDSGATWTAYYDDTVALNRAGSDFYVYACQTNTSTPLLLLSRNSTYPHGYTADNSRKIAGFHCLCNSVGTISGHTLTGYLTGDVLPASVWDYNWRSASGSNVGLVYDSRLRKWVAIYFTSGTVSAPTIVNGGTILDTITWFQACDAGKALKMKLPKDYEFQVFAAGSPEAVNIYGSADPVTAGGYISTGSVRMISNIGVEGCAGQLWQWLDDQSYRFDAATAHTHSITVSGDAQTVTSGGASADVAPAWGWKAQTGGKGSLYTQGTYGTTKLIAGGSWGSGAGCGSRARSAIFYPWDASSLVGFRLITDHIERGA